MNVPRMRTNLFKAWSTYEVWKTYEAFSAFLSSNEVIVSVEIVNNRAMIIYKWQFCYFVAHLKKWTWNTYSSVNNRLAFLELGYVRLCTNVFWKHSVNLVLLFILFLTLVSRQ
jgi:hypothetical protein